MKNSLDIRIIWDGWEEKEEFHEKWTTNFSDNSAYYYNHNLKEINRYMRMAGLQVQ